MMGNKEQLIDIYGMWYQPFWEREWFIVLKIIGIVLLAGALFYYLYKKYMQRNSVIDCAIVAQQELDRLRNFHIVTKQDSKDCYFSLSSIVKHYLACRYHGIFLRLTDEEIIKQSMHYMSDDNVRLLQQILQGMQLVKFEHEIAMTRKLEKDIEFIEKFIENTTPQPDIKEN